MSERVDVADLAHLTALLDADWLQQAVAGRRRQGEHPLKSFWDQPDPGRDEILLALDRAVSVLRSGPLGGEAATRNCRRLRAKLRNPRGFWSAVSELVWAARLMAIGRVTIEPHGGGPDFFVEREDARFFVEVYAPDETAGSIHEDFEFPLTRWWQTLPSGGRGVRVSVYASTLERKPKVVYPLLRVLKRAVRRVRFRDTDTCAIHVQADGHEIVEGATQEDSERDARRGTLVAFVSSPSYLVEGHIRVSSLTVGSWEAGTSKNPYRHLSQLVRGELNVLVIDRTRDTLREWVDPALIHGRDGPFFDHPELAALVLAQWGMYTTPDGRHLHEKYELIESGLSNAVRLPRLICEQLVTTNLF